MVCFKRETWLSFYILNSFQSFKLLSLSLKPLFCELCAFIYGTYFVAWNKWIGTFIVTFCLPVSYITSRPLTSSEYTMVDRQYRRTPIIHSVNICLGSYNNYFPAIISVPDGYLSSLYMLGLGVLIDLLGNLLSKRL